MNAWIDLWKIMDGLFCCFFNRNLLGFKFRLILKEKKLHVIGEFIH